MHYLFIDKNLPNRMLQNMPLAERMRPINLKDFVGQKHLVGPTGIINKIVTSGTIPSIILWGPPGTGKTTLARIIAEQSKANFYTLNAVSSGVKDLRLVIEKARFGGKSILFIDEIHRFNKSQQDALLHAVETGIIRLIGATTENPSFEVNNALLSRCQVFVLKALERKDLEGLLTRAIEKDEELKKKNIKLKETDALLQISGGDARRLLNLLELVVQHEEEKTEIEITNDVVQAAAKDIPRQYDKKGDFHYNIISAFIKSIRGSDPNGAVYWLARMIDSGEDIKFIARRLIISAAEDVGLANPTALIMANNCMQAIQTVGLPEARIILSQATLYLATSPKSNSAYMAINHALQIVKQTGDLNVPPHLCGAYTAFNKDLGYGKEYKYAHDYPGSFVQQEYLPNELKGQIIYNPNDNSREELYRKDLQNKWNKKYTY